MPRRRLIVIIAMVVALGVALALAFHLAVERLRNGVEQALGPRASIGALHAGWRGVELRDVRIRADRRGRAPWPADDEFRAASVQIVPELASLWSSTWRVRSVTVHDGYVSLLRSRDGRLRVLPSLLGGGGTATASPPVRIGQVRLDNATVDFHDATVRQPPHRVRLERLEATVGPLALPSLDETVDLEMQAVFKGSQRDGRLSLAGQATPATRTAAIDARASGIDLLALQPYLLRAAEGGVKRGTLDLQLDARVERNRLHAPGTLVLTGLEFGSGSGAFATFAGVPRQALVAALARDGRIEVRFTLDGRLDDPTFSLNESFALRVANGIAEGLGVSLGGVVDGVGGVIKGLLGR